MNCNFKDNVETLEMLKFGYARVGKDWQGEAIRSQYSRLYFIKRGSFYVIDGDGQRTDFYEGGIYLIPSGFSYTYGCEDENEHYYFHIRLFGFDKLSDIINSPSITASLVIKSELYFVLSEIALNSCGLLDTTVYSNDINSAINYVSTNLSAGLSVSEIAQAVNLAVSTLSSKFRREVGMSVGEYIDYRVTLAAAQMLLTKNNSILEISDALGFCDQFYFSRRFKARYRVSPKKFRKLQTANI